MSYLHTKFDIPNWNDPLVNAITPNAEYIFLIATMLFFYILQKEP
jgi:hypothetical protein